MKSRTVVVFLLTLPLIFSIASAQRFAEVSGTVTDATGAVLPGVTVTVTSADAGVNKMAITTDAGLYRVIELNPGAYRVSAQLDGFKTAVVEATLETMKITTVDIAMEIGEIADQVTVEAAGLTLERQSAKVSTFIEEKMIEDLPQLLKRPLDMIKYAAAVSYRGTWSLIPGQSTYYSMNGVPYQAGEIYVDGAYGMSGRAYDSNPDTSPRTATVKEMRIVQNSFKAEYNGGGGGLVIMSTKSGTNSFHGSVWEFHRQKALDARNFFAARRDPFREHLYGFEVDGPIIKDKLHFMISGSGKRSFTPTGSRFRTFPTEAQRRGDFSGKFNADGSLRTIYDPLSTVENPDGSISRTAFPNNIIPADRISSQAQRILSFLPLPNRAPDDPSGSNNYVGLTANPLALWGWTARVDWQADDDDKIFVRFISDPSVSESIGAWTPPSGFDTSRLPDDAISKRAERNPADPDDWLMRFDQLNQAAGWTHTFSPSVISDFRQTYNELSQWARPLSQGLNFPQEIGIAIPPEIPATNTYGTNNHFPHIGIAGYTGPGAGWGGGSAINPRRGLHFGETLTWLEGAHSFKVGIETRRSGHAYFQASNSSGRYNFSSNATASNPFDAASGDSVASLLLDRVDAASISNVAQRNFSTWYWGMFIQDDWRVSPNVIVNLGLRYDFDTPIRERNNLISSFDLNAINPVCNCPGAFFYPDKYYETQKSNFAPRLGVAWNPGGGKTVVRAGAGIYYMQPMIGMNPWQTPRTGRGDVTVSKNLSSPDHGVTPAISGLSAGVGAIPVFELQPGFGAVEIGQPAILRAEYLCCPELRQNPYSIGMSFTLQHEIRDIVLEAGYIGNLTRHLGEWSYNLNQLRPQLMGPNATQADRPYPQYSAVNQISVPDKTMTYHAMVLKAEKRFGGGLAFLSNFTWSKHLGNREGRFNVYDRASARGPAWLSRRLRFVVAGTYELPIGINRAFLNDGLVAKILGGWNTSFAFIGQSGVPLNFYASPNLTGSFGGNSRATRLRNGKGPQTIEAWWDINAFVHPGPFVFGNAGVGIVEGPGSQTVDFSLMKDFNILEGTRLRLTADFFNFLNRANFNDPSTSVCPAAAPCTTNRITGAQFARQTQLGLQFFF